MCAKLGHWIVSFQPIATAMEANIENVQLLFILCMYQSLIRIAHRTTSNDR